MRAALHTPYLDTLGGGERYMLSVARVLLESGWEVDIEASRPSLINKAEKRFNLKLTELNPVKDIKRGDGYDMCVWLSDGSIPLLRSRNNILHFQRPFQGVDGKSLLNRMKFIRISHVIVNSQFTKSWIDKEYPTNSKVLYPPVDVKKFAAMRKENIILYVGRFSQLEQSKNQDVLLDAFLKFYEKNSDWKLVLAGGSEVGRTDFVDKLKANAKGKSIEVLENPNFKTIKNLYGKSKIFWSAAGFGIDIKKEPQKLEHFGITLVEAMAARCIPVIYDGGGHREIIKHGNNGLLWTKKYHLVKLTDDLISDIPKMRELSKSAYKDSKKYSYENFKNFFLKLL